MKSENMKSMQIWINAEQHKSLKEISYNDGVAVSELIRDMIDEYLSKRKEKVNHE